MIIIEQNIQLSGLATELTKSQSDNFVIIQNHWMAFNQELKKYKLSQDYNNWVKYGITYKVGEQYFYLTAIPKNNLIFPDHFKSFEIPQGEYEVFLHKGKMANIKNTYNEIYKVILPNSTLKILGSETVGFIHFEKYDQRFHWSKPSSVIEIYLPLESNK